MEGRAGDRIGRHFHRYAHELYVESGQMRVAVNDAVTVVTGPGILAVPSGILHAIDWLTDGVVSCWHIARYENGREFPPDVPHTDAQFDEAVSAL